MSAQPTLPWVDRVELIIELRAAEALIEIRQMADDARHFINRSCGQKARRLRERFSQHTVEKQ